MRHKGSKNEYEQERNLELFRCYKELLYQSKHIRRKEIFVKLVNMPCSRFWVSEFRAAIILSEMFKGKPLSCVRRDSRDMYQEIFRRASIIRKEHPNMEYFMLAFNVVNQPAPRFYITPLTAEVIITRMLSQKRRKLL